MAIRPSQPQRSARAAAPRIAAGRRQHAPKRPRTVADNLVLANLSGHDSHGVGMVPRYVDAVLEGGLQPNAARQGRCSTAAACSRWTASAATARSSASRRWRWRMARAKQHGSCIMALANAHHLGRIGHFAEMAVARGPGVASTSSTCCRGRWSRPGAAATAASAPTPAASACRSQGREPFVLDFATSRVAQGKMRVAHNEGRQVEPGYLIDEQGRPTDRPGRGRGAAGRAACSAR